MWLTHVAVQKELAQHCKAIILYKFQKGKRRAYRNQIFPNFTGLENCTSVILKFLDQKYFKYPTLGDFTGGPVFENLPSKAGDMGSTPGQGAEFPHGEGTTKPMPHN